MSNYPLLTRVLSSCVQIARRAGRLLHEVKLHANAQTIVDHSYVHTALELSTACITKSLRSTYPKLNLCYANKLNDSTVGDNVEIEKDFEMNILDIGKSLNEFMPIYADIEEKDLYVWIDPLNGSIEYTEYEHIHEVTILIGIAWKGTPIAGVINQPFYSSDIEDLFADRYTWGLCGLGAFNHVDGKIIEVENRLNRIYNSMQNRLITSTELATHYRHFMNDILTLNNFEILPAGQCGFNVLCLIDGFVDCFLYPSKGTKRWETCACEAIMYSIGGRLKNTFGDNYTYARRHAIDNDFGIIASIFNNDQYIKCLKHDVLMNMLSRLPREPTIEILTDTVSEQKPSLV